MPSNSATSASVGVRPSAAVSSWRAAVVLRARARTDRLAQSWPAQFVQQGAADADRREAVERDAAGDVERSRGAQQRGEPGGRQVVGVDMAGYAVQQFPDQMANHRHVFADEVLDVTRGRRVVGRADGGGEFGRGSHVVLLARSDRW